MDRGHGLQVSPSSSPAAINIRLIAGLQEQPLMIVTHRASVQHSIEYRCIWTVTGLQVSGDEGKIGCQSNNLVF